MLLNAPVSKYHFPREIIPYLKGFNSSIKISLFTLLLLMNASTSYSNYIHFQGKLFLSKDNPSSFIAN